MDEVVCKFRAFVFRKQFSFFQDSFICPWLQLIPDSHTHNMFDVVVYTSPALLETDTKCHLRTSADDVLNPLFSLGRGYSFIPSKMDKSLCRDREMMFTKFRVLFVVVMCHSRDCGQSDSRWPKSRTGI